MNGGSGQSLKEAASFTISLRCPEHVDEELKLHCSACKELITDYEIGLKASERGHNLHIRVKGEKIEECLYVVEDISGIKRPYGLACGPNHELVVSGRGDNSIHVLSSDRKKLQSFRIGQVKTCSITYLAMDKESNIFVAVVNADKHQVLQFTTSGQFLNCVGGVSGSGQLHFNIPDGIAYNSINDFIYVSDSRNNRIQILSSSLDFVKEFGSQGSRDGQFDEPRGIACDDKGRLYVADVRNHRIQVFDSDGNFHKAFGHDYLKAPINVAVVNGTVYVSEDNIHRISVFSSDGRFIKSFGEEGSELGQFHCPRGIAVDTDGKIYVCDSQNNRIQVFVFNK